jgi:hypothetical protein
MAANEAGGIIQILGELRWLADLISEYAESLLAQESLSSFTDHSSKHSWRLIRIIDTLIENRVSLEPYEALILFGTAFLHDISLTSPGAILLPEQKARGWYEAELRQHHGSYSARYLRAVMVSTLTGERNPNSERVRQNLDLLEGIARICEFHTASSYEESAPVAPSDRLARIQVLSAIFVLADTLDAGSERVRTPDVIRSTMPLKVREYWLSHACIQVSVH